MTKQNSKAQLCSEGLHHLTKHNTYVRADGSKSCTLCYRQAESMKRLTFKLSEVNSKLDTILALMESR